MCNSGLASSHRVARTPLRGARRLLTRARRGLATWVAAAVLLAPAPLLAQATSVAPQVIHVTDRTPSGAITVLNQNEVPLDVRIGLRYGDLVTDSSTGATTVRILDDSVAPANSAVPLIRFSPVRFRLAPGATQIVRIVALSRAALADGEYWARMSITSRRDERPTTGTTTNPGVAGEISLQVQTVIPVYFRKGPVRTGLTAAITSAVRSPSGVELSLRFDRTGNGAAVGALQLDALDANGTVLASETRQLAVYHALTPRVSLPVPAAVLARVQQVRVTVTSRRPDLPEGFVLPFTPVTVTAPLTSPPDGSGNPPTAPGERLDAAPAAPWGALTSWQPPHDASLEAPEAPEKPDDLEEPEGVEIPADTLGVLPRDQTGTVSRGPRTPTAADTITATRSIGLVDPLRTGTDTLRRDPDVGVLAVAVAGVEVGTILTLEGPSLGHSRVPLRGVARLLGIAVDSLGPRALHITSRGQQLLVVTVDPRTGTATRRVGSRVTEQVELGAQALQWEGGDWYVDPVHLPALMGISARVDEPTSTLVVDTPRELLPRLTASRPRRQVESDGLAELLTWSPASRLQRGGWLPSGLTLTYNAAVDNTTGDHMAVSTLGTTVLGGGLSTQIISSRLTGHRRLDAMTSWLGGNPKNPWLRQLRLGAGSSTGPLPISGNGVSLTNAPFLRSANIGTVVRSGSAPPGAEVEISRNGQVIGIATADSTGHWSLPVPVMFGENAIEVAIYTADGVRRSSALFGLETDLIAARQVEYGLTAQSLDMLGSECRLGVGACGLMGNADLRIGLSTRLTVRAGSYQLRFPDGIVRSEPYATVAASPVNALQVRGEAAREGWWRARAVFQPSLRLRLEVGQEVIDSARAPFWLGARARFSVQERQAQVTIRPFARDLGRFWISSQWRELLHSHSVAAGLSGTVGVRTNGMLLQAIWDGIQQRGPFDPVPQRGGTATLSLTVPQWRRGPTLLRRTLTTLSGAMDTQQRLQLVSAQAALAMGPGLQVQAAADWRPFMGASVRVQFQQQGPFATLVQSVLGSVRGVAQSTTTLLGSASVRPGTSGVRLSNDFVALRSAIAGVAFEDLDGNGQPGPAEPRLANLVIRVGRTTFRTDAAGQFVATGLPVLDAIPVSPELPFTYSPDGRSLVTSVPVQWSLLVPFGETRVNIPYVPAASGVAEAPPGAWTGTLLSLDHKGARAQPLEVFDDGIIPLGPAPAGTYRIDLRERGREASTDHPRQLSCTVTLTLSSGVRVRVPEVGGADVRCVPVP